jgi:hypothetical protein
MNPVLELHAVADEMQPPAGTLTLGAHLRIGQPDRRHQIAPAKLGEHPRVDAVGLARQRRQPLDLPRVGDLDIPAQLFQAVMHKPGAVHRLDRRAHHTQRRQPLGQPAQPVGVRRRLRLKHRCASDVDDMHVNALAR